MEETDSARKRKRTEKSDLDNREKKKIKPGNDTSDEESDKGSHVTSSSSSYKGGTDTDSSSESELDAHHTPMSTSFSKPVTKPRHLCPVCVLSRIRGTEETAQTKHRNIFYHLTHLHDLGATCTAWPFLKKGRKKPEAFAEEMKEYLLANPNHCPVCDRSIEAPYPMDVHLGYEHAIWLEDGPKDVDPRLVVGCKIQGEKGRVTAKDGRRRLRKYLKKTNPVLVTPFPKQPPKTKTSVDEKRRQLAEKKGSDLTTKTADTSGGRRKSPRFNSFTDAGGSNQSDVALQDCLQPPKSQPPPVKNTEPLVTWSATNKCTTDLTNTVIQYYRTCTACTVAVNIKFWDVHYMTCQSRFLLEDGEDLIEFTKRHNHPRNECLGIHCDRIFDKGSRSPESSSKRQRVGSQPSPTETIVPHTSNMQKQAATNGSPTKVSKSPKSLGVLQCVGDTGIPLSSSLPAVPVSSCASKQTVSDNLKTPQKKFPIYLCNYDSDETDDYEGAQSGFPKLIIDEEEKNDNTDEVPKTVQGDDQTQKSDSENGNETGSGETQEEGKKSVSTPDESCEVVEDLDRDIDVLLANVGAKLKASVREGNTLQTLELWRQLLETKSSGSVENDGGSNDGEVKLPASEESSGAP